LALSAEFSLLKALKHGSVMGSLWEVLWAYDSAGLKERPPQFKPQHFLYFLPDPQGHGSLRPSFPPVADVGRC